MRKLILLAVGLLLLFIFVGCDTIEEVFPMPDETANPTPTPRSETSTPLPTLGELTALDAAYCLQSDPDAHELEFNIIRFFPSGVVMQVNIKGQKSCSEAWEYLEPFLIETATDIYSHGEYQHSEGEVRFALAPPGSDETSGEVTGRIEGDELIITLQGTQKTYTRVYGG